MSGRLRAETVAVISRSPHTIQASCREVGVSRSSYYRWRAKLQGNRPAQRRKAANALRETERRTILEQALAQPHLSARQLACWCCDRAGFSVSESSVRRILKAHGLLLPRAAEQAPAAIGPYSQGVVSRGGRLVLLPVLEDSVLAQRSAEGSLRLYDLLQTSAVCGTGLDTVPLPGDLREATIQSILYDVAALSLRLSKPLTARLMPLPGKQPGDPVDFGFEYFAPGGILTLEDSPTHANTSISFLKTDALMLQPYHRPHEKSCSDSGSNNDTNV